MTAGLAICVPVRDEERMLPALLAALAAQTSAPQAVACFYLDGCGDGSEAVLRAASLPFEIVVTRNPRPGAPNAGAARRAATALGLARVGPDGVLLTTDADSQPQPDWIARARHALTLADFAAGRVLRTGASADEVQSRLERYLDRLHAYRRQIDPVAWDDWRGHHWSGGANLAFRAGAYRAVGGFRPLPSGEDATLLDDASRAGFRVRRDAAMLVATSSRRIGRAPGGLADALRRTDAGGMPRVAHPARVAWQYRAQAAARRVFAEPAAFGAFGTLLGLSGDHVLGVARDCPNAEAFAARIVPVAPGLEQDVPLNEAEALLAGLERDLCGEAA